MIKIRDKIKVSNVNAIVVKVFDDNTLKIIYKNNGYRVLDDVKFINGLWKFEQSGVSGRKLENNEYSDYEI